MTDAYYLKVFSKDVAKTLRGPSAAELLPCPACGNITGKYLSLCAIEHMRGYARGFTSEPQRFTMIVWERWKCENCSKVWVEKYGVYNYKDW